MLGAAQALLEDVGIQLNQMGQKLFDIYISAARGQLGEEVLADSMAAGRAMDLETSLDCIAFSALTTSLHQETEVGPAGGTQSPMSLVSDSLTRREREIAVLVAKGISNREIADTLVVSDRTVEWHTSNIL